MSSDQIEDYRWQDSAECRGVDPELFYPPRGNSTQVAEARAYCEACVVKEVCLEENLHEREGIFGGMTGRQRKLLRKSRAMKRPCLQCSRPFHALGTAKICSDACRTARYDSQRARRRATAMRQNG